jgi:hypothetical protein
MIVYYVCYGAERSTYPRINVDEPLVDLTRVACNTLHEAKGNANYLNSSFYTTYIWSVWIEVCDSNTGEVTEVIIVRKADATQ